MALYLDTRRRETLGIGICSRCSRKLPLGELRPDPNAPGLRVCEADQDVIDPYRLPAPSFEPTVLPFVRPEESIGTSPYGTITEDGDEFLITEDGESWIVP